MSISGDVKPPRARTWRERLPLHGFVQDGAVGRVDGAGGGGDVLDAEHHEGLVARVADGALAGGGDADDAALLHRDVRAVDLVLPFAREEEVELLVVLVDVVEAAFGPGREDLEGEVGAAGLHGRAAEDLAGDLDAGAEFELVVLQLGQRPEIDGGGVGDVADGLDRFHDVGFCCGLFVFEDSRVQRRLRLRSRFEVRFADVPERVFPSRRSSVSASSRESPA